MLVEIQIRRLLIGHTDDKTFVTAPQTGTICELADVPERIKLLLANIESLDPAAVHPELEYREMTEREMVNYRHQERAARDSALAREGVQSETHDMRKERLN